MSFKVDEGRQVTAKITGLIEPFTVCSLLLVELDDEQFQGQGQLLLKLYDRRFASSMRLFEEARPWSEEIEEEYRSFVHDEQMEPFMDEVRRQCPVDRYYLTDNWPEWSRAQQEAYLWHILDDSYHQEKKSYEMMQDIQGVHIPRIFSCVSVQTNPQGEANEFLEIPGFLMQYIEGFTLEYIKEAPPEAWQGICDEAISIVHKVRDYGILNRHVRPRSFVVKQEDGKYKVFMLDFGMVRFRTNAWGEGQWKHWQADEDEEGCIADRMKQMLGDGFEYKPSQKRMELKPLKDRIWI